MKTFDLRPLGVGEILDRAVTLYVGRFASLMLIIAVFAVPAAVLTYLAQPDTSGYLNAMVRLLQLPPGHTAERTTLMNEMAAGTGGPWLFVQIAFSLLVGQLANMAMVMGLSDALDGKTIAVRAIYARAVKRWVPLLVTDLLYFGVLIAASIAFFFVAFLASLVIVGLAAISKTMALIIGIPLGIAALVVTLGVFGLAYLAWNLSIVAVATEDPNPIRATASGLRRTFGGGMFWRSTLVGLSLVVVQIVGSQLLVIVALALAYFTKINVLSPIVSVIGGVALAGLIVSYVVVYALDVRVRREGYDLRLAAEAADPA